MRVEMRKIYSSGGSSYIITLPKRWVEENNLKVGDSIIMQIGENSITITTKRSETKRRREAVIDAKDLKGEFLIRRIISYYLAGYDSLRVKVYNEEHRRSVALASDILIGAEVIEDLGKEIFLEIFLDDARFKPDDIIEKMGNICITMVSDFCTVLKNLDRYVCSSILIREGEVDRLHFLVLRQLKTAIRYSDSPIGVQPSKALEYRTVVRAYERIADHSANMAESLLKIGKPLPEFCELVETVLDMLKTASVSFFKKDMELADVVLEEFDEMSEKEKKFYRLVVNHDVEEALHTKTILDSLIRIAGYSADIAEVVINMCVPD
jgi:phosphate uptake regulator